MRAYTTLLTPSIVSALRASTGFSRRYISGLLGVSENTLAKWENRGMTSKERIEQYVSLIEGMQTNAQLYQEAERQRHAKGHTVWQHRLHWKTHPVPPYRFFKFGHKHHLWGITGVPTDSDYWLECVHLGWNGRSHEYQWKLMHRDELGNHAPVEYGLATLKQWKAFKITKS